MQEAVQHPPKVLIVAPNVSSRFGGESFLPLQYFRLLRRRGYPVQLLTHARNRSDIEATLGLDPNSMHFVEDTAAHRLAWRMGSRLPAVLREVVVDKFLALLDARNIAAIIRQLVENGEVSVIHQPTPVSPLAPSALHRFGVPLIVGPMNGGMNYPPGYDDLEGRMARSFVAFSRRLAWLLNRMLPGKREAAVLLVANERTRRSLPFAHHPDVRLLVENGVDLETWEAGTVLKRSALREDRRPGTLRLVFMGRLVDWKLVALTLEAVRLSRGMGVEVTLDVLGDGPERPALEQAARDPGLDQAVRFHGFLPQTACAEILAGADALILNSVRECGGAVVLEAMALGLPVIASEWGGPADYLDSSCGILVSPVPRNTFAARLAEAIERLAQSPELCRAMGAEAARKVAEQYDWPKKVDIMTAIYAEVASATRSTSSVEPATHTRAHSSESEI